MPISTVDLSALSVVCCRFWLKTMCTPVVLEKPGLDAWPPDLTANGVLLAAMYFNFGHVSKVSND